MTVDPLVAARGLARRGGPTDLREADRLLTLAVAEGAQAPCLHAAQDLARAHLWLEYGLLPEVAITEDPEDDRERCRDSRTTDALLALANRDLEGTRAAIAAAAESPADPSLAPAHGAWIAGKLALLTASGEPGAGRREPPNDPATDPASDQASDQPSGLPADQASEDPERDKKHPKNSQNNDIPSADENPPLAAAQEAIQAALAEDPEYASYHRLLGELRLRQGDLEGALAALRAGRGHSRTHLGLAVDEALYLAQARRELSSVADLTDQLLGIEAAAMGPYDRGRAALARAVVHLHSGEPERSLGRLREAWRLLATWDRLGRLGSLTLALEAGDAALARGWLAEAELDPTTAAILEAWALLVEGEAMASLGALARLPQAAPRVAYLQGLALVEERRLAEAEAWITRARRLYPGWVELEVASARIAVEHGDLEAALRRLQGLAEEESYAPRAWTGLGEAYLAQARAAGGRPGGTTAPALAKAHSALKRAVEREPRPAEAMLRLGEVWKRWRRTDPEGERRALEWFERAVETAPQVARYRLALAHYLIDLGDYRRAEGLLRDLIDAPGVNAAPALALADLALAQAALGEALPAGFDGWLATARELGASADQLLDLEARAALLGRRWSELGRLRRALAVEVEGRPEEVDLRVLYARILMALRDDEEALRVVRRGIYVGRSDEEEGDGRLFLVLAELEARDAKRVQGAIHARAAWNRLKESERPTVELLAAAELGTALMVRTEQEAAARALVRDLTRHLPIHGEAWRIRARTEFALGETTEARRSIERARTLAPESAEVLGLHGRILLRFGARQEAIAALERAIELGGERDEAEQWRRLLRRSRR